MITISIAILNIFQNTREYITGLSFIDVIDILLVLFLLYELFNLIRGTVAFNIFLGILSIYLVWKLVIYLEMTLLSEILGQFISVGVIALIIVFQQEIRKFLLMLGTPQFFSKKRKRFLFWRLNIAQFYKTDLTIVTQFIKSMSIKKTGALIIITKKIRLEEVVNTGIPIDGIISTEFLESIFWKNSPLHDGAVIITDNRIVAAKCILPLSEKDNLPNDIGLRHRAALGIAEASDALAIVVSEQTGEITIASNGKLIRNISFTEIKNMLEAELS